MFKCKGCSNAEFQEAGCVGIYDCEIDNVRRYSDERLDECDNFNPKGDDEGV